jgi:hypothetical protein
MYSLLPKHGEPCFYGQTTHFIFFEAEILFFIKSAKRKVFKALNELSKYVVIFILFNFVISVISLQLWKHFSPSGSHLGIFSVFFSERGHQN